MNRRPGHVQYVPYGLAVIGWCGQPHPSRCEACETVSIAPPSATMADSGGGCHTMSAAATTFDCVDRSWRWACNGFYLQTRLGDRHVRRTARWPDRHGLGGAPRGPRRQLSAAAAAGPGGGRGGAGCGGGRGGSPAPPPPGMMKVPPSLVALTCPSGEVSALMSPDTVVSTHGAKHNAGR